ncbi:RagB/SusD family nutrient uptake outer membrane protein [Algoriphagus sp. D3-2-R+10]|uniref:RagB/SusD family nutrient uptake outer membrane protein n=1 Tax=Algoriphagus aurantiacus TaxID=3103948 RepID=UPI002B3B8A65|nr:RagB/SusD family nutrient uptake outer membrane protein [Algoriphagus sp. D3-2-R+10]MEB2774675.1 RagB/SusD family nutrient uptake outer membrane protein [Algoriphagus sp. D3-2-R+10]
MTKKIYSKIICLLTAGSLLTGCFDLEYENFNKINSENFPQSEADLHAATIGVYHSLGNSFVMRFMDNSGFILNTLSTDEMNTAWGHGWFMIDNFLWQSNNMAGSGLYNEYQKGVTKATRIIDAFDKSDVEESRKNKSIAELRVLRVLYANLLYSMVGPVPIVTDAEIANNVYSEWKPARPGKEEYVSFMVNEILASYDLLDATVSAQDYGRLTKGAALTLLMKIYLNDKQWDKAANVAKQVMDMGVYDLLPSYKSVFSSENEGPVNKEVIFPIQRITSDLSFSWTYFAAVLPSVPMYKAPNGNQMQIWGGLRMPWAYYDKYEDQDERLETIIRYYTDVNGNEVDFRAVDHPRAIGASPMKYSEDPEHRGADQGSDFIMLRYADVILSRAEALNELSGPTQECIDLINMVRERANATLLDHTEYTKESLRDFLLDERGRELYCEGHRRNDLIRHGKFIEKAQEAGKSAQPYHVLFPIPQSVMNENPNLRQNDGYEN